MLCRFNMVHSGRVWFIREKRSLDKAQNRDPEGNGIGKLSSSLKTTSR